MQAILTVDLTTGQTGRWEPPLSWVQEYLGGASLAARLLYDHMEARLDPLGPKAPLLFLTGPLTGTAGPAVGRFVVAGRSPATGLWAESNCGGFWGPELRKTGYDGIWITGSAREPVYLWLDESGCEIRPAGSLWGLETYETQEAVRAELGDGRARVASIGPAGEALIPFALILCDHGRVAGRTGLGAVMGAKRLKAVAVRGQGQIPIAAPAEFASLRQQSNRELREDNVSRSLRALGSASGSELFDYLGEMPKRYFEQGEFEGSARVSGSSLAETILSGVSTCHACVIACGRVVRLHGGTERKGPEYETIAGFGPNLLIDDLAAITALGELCDRYGMDSISLSNVIGLAFHLFDQGSITLADTDGLELRWGDADVARTLVERTVKRLGFGAALAAGAQALADRFGRPETALQVNGLEVPYHDPRGASGMAIVYATSPRGACHNQSDYFMVDLGHCEESLGIHYFDRHEGAEKAANVARHQDWRTICNALVLCFFANVPPERTLDLVNACTGLRQSMADLIRAGERGWNLKRLINIRLGLSRANDTLPRALLKAYSSGGAAGFVLDWPAMLEAYYRARGWDPQTGVPSRARLVELGLEWAAAEIGQDP